MSEFGRALVDRRDVTAQREGHGMTEITPTDMTETNTLLRRIISTLETSVDVDELVFIDSSLQPSLVIDPSIGLKRRVLNRTPIAPATTVITTSPSLIFNPNVNRYGGLVVVTGANPVTLVLGIDVTNPVSPTTSSFAGYATVPLSGTGAGTPSGSWDFRFSDALWCGSVYAFCPTGSSSIGGGEL